jgi:transcriptional regulator of heat shock response
MQRLTPVSPVSPEPPLFSNAPRTSSQHSPAALASPSAQQRLLICWSTFTSAASPSAAFSPSSSLAVEWCAIASSQTAANFLNEYFRGWNIDRVRSELARRIDHERAAYQQLADAQLASDANELWSRTIPPNSVQQQSVYIDGVVNLIGLPADRDRLRAMLSALEEKQRLIELLNAYIDTSEHSVRVIFDLEHQDPGMAGLVLIAAPAQISGDSAVAILGPKRMNYESAINAVSYVAQLLHRIDTGDIAPLSP